MRDIYIDKVVVHMGVGESGEKLVKAENIMKTITKQTPIRSIARMTQPAFSIRKGAPIGCKVTLRGKSARDFFSTSIGIINKTVFESQFDKSGNISFGMSMWCLNAKAYGSPAGAWSRKNSRQNSA
jgi:large subunit ribosomal protein L5